MVYEASQRFRNLVHGCVGVISDLQKKVAELELQLASTKAKLKNISMQHANLFTIITGYQEAPDPNFYCLSPQESEDTDVKPLLFL